MSSPTSSRSTRGRPRPREHRRPGPGAGVARRAAALLLGLATGCATGSVAIAADTESARAGVPSAPAEGGPRRWAVAAPEGLSLRAAPAADARITGVVAEGAVLSNLGCEAGEGGAWCAVRPFRGGMRGYAPADLLRPAEGPDGTVPVGADDSRERARRGDVDAWAEVGCAQEAGAPMGSCTAGVARSGGGDATVIVRFPNGFARSLHFVHGAFVAANVTMAGVGTDIDWRVENGVHVLRVDGQRYRLPASFVFGE